MSDDPPKAGAETGQDTSADGTPRRKHTRTWYAVGGAVGVALLGATASALITPERVDYLFGGLSADGPPSASLTPSPIEYATVKTTSGAIILDVPMDWGARDARWNVSDDPGVALRTGYGIESEIPFDLDGAYIGASAGASATAGAAAMSDSERRTWLRSFIERDWTVDGCVPRPDPEWEKSGWHLEATRWDDCASFEGSRLYEFAAVDRDSEVLVVSQIILSAESDDSVAEKYVESFVVDPSKIPGRTTSGDFIVP